jgi:hypothetical protein
LRFNLGGGAGKRADLAGVKTPSLGDQFVEWGDRGLLASERSSLNPLASLAELDEGILRARLVEAQSAARAPGGGRTRRSEQVRPDPLAFPVDLLGIGEACLLAEFM